MSSESDRPTFAARPITTVSAAHQIAEQIRTAILAGQLQPGERLPAELELASDYAVSRGTIRETIKILSAQHLVETTRGASGGTFVNVPEGGTAAAALGETITLWFNAGNTSLGEVLGARAWIERGCVRLAADHGDRADVDEIEAAVVAMEAPGLDMDGMLAIDIDFHGAVARAAHNSVLELSMTAIHLMRPFTNTMIVHLLAVDAVAEQHRAIYEPIRAGDSAAAEAAFDAHMHYLDDVRRQALVDRRAEDVQIASLPSEAHPDFESIRARVLAQMTRLSSEG